MKRGSRMMEIAELQEQHGKDWHKHYSGNPFREGSLVELASRLRILALYLGIFVLGIYVLAMAVAPILIITQGRRIATLEKEIAAERHRIDFILPTWQAINAGRGARP